jgi:RNA polymerase sigma factor (sigma-70 family)
MPHPTENPPAPPASGAPSGGGFHTTRWTVIAAARDKNSAASLAAWDQLARRYWPAVFAYVRGRGFATHDAQDLTQDFFARLLRLDDLRAADPAKGRFRTFLRVAISRFLLNEWDRRRAAKRGGGREVVSLDALDTPARERAEPVDEASAERIYERRWALTLLERALARLRAEYEGSGRAAEFAALKELLVADRADVDHAALAANLNTTEGAARVALHRLRKRLRVHFRAEVADTVADEGELEAELRHVIALLGQK